MNKMIVYSLAVGIVMYVLLIYMAFVQRDLTGPQLILMLATPLIVGFLSGGIKRGLAIGFLLSFVMLMVEVIILQGATFANPNVAMAVVLGMVLPLAAISAGLGATGGLLGRRMFKKSK